MDKEPGSSLFKGFDPQGRVTGDDDELRRGCPRFHEAEDIHSAQIIIEKKKIRLSAQRHFKILFAGDKKIADRKERKGLENSFDLKAFCVVR